MTYKLFEFFFVLFLFDFTKKFAKVLLTVNCVVLVSETFLFFFSLCFWVILNGSEILWYFCFFFCGNANEHEFRFSKTPTQLLDSDFRWLVLDNDTMNILLLLRFTSLHYSMENHIFTKHTMLNAQFIFNETRTNHWFEEKTR